jgi:ribosome-associated protein
MKTVVAPYFAVEDSEIEERFVLSSGPGGQNVNKVSSAVELRFDASRSPSLTDEIRARLRLLAGRRMTKNGILILHARRFRDQQRNRADARARLFELLAQAVVAPRQRRPTKPNKASRERRLEGKRFRANVKKARSSPAGME